MIRRGSGQAPGLLALVLSGLCLTCHSSDSTLGRPCPGGQVCGFSDHKYFSTFYCPPRPLFPGGSMGYSWRDLSHCHQECNAASIWGRRWDGFQSRRQPQMENRKLDNTSLPCVVWMTSG